LIAQIEMLKKRYRWEQAMRLIVIVVAFGAAMALCVFMFVTP